MNALFLTVLQMSLSGVYVIAAVLLVRLLLCRAPKRWSYLLWSAAGFRLCCPVSFRAALSLFTAVPIEPPVIRGSLSMPITPSAAAEPVAVPIVTASSAPLWPALGTVIWCAGMLGMLLYALAQWVRLRRLTFDACRVKGKIYETDRIQTPFLMGLLRPRIYLPVDVEGQTLEYVIAHERYHLRRHDHWAKAAAWLILTIHWFNPVCWLAYLLMNRDLERSCDEHVLSALGGRADYSRSLLHFATGRRFPAPGTLTFGESDAKARVRSVLRWKRPRVRTTLLAAVVCALTLLLCAANPKQAEEHQNTEIQALFDRLSALQSYEIDQLRGGLLYGETVTASELADALHAAAESAVLRTDLSDTDAGIFPPLWECGCTLHDWDCEEMLTLTAGAAPDLVTLRLGTSDTERARFVLNSPELYQLLRQCYTTKVQIQPDALNTCRSALEEYLRTILQHNQSAFTGYEITRCVRYTSVDDGMDHYDVYRWDARFSIGEGAHPSLAGGANLDSDGMAVGCVTAPYLAFRNQNEYRFLSDELPDPASDIGKTQLRARLHSAFVS